MKQRYVSGIYADNRYLLSFCIGHIMSKPTNFYCHEELEIAFFDKLKGIYTIDGKEWEINGREIFLIQNDVSHGITRIDKPGMMYTLQINPKIVKNGMTFFQKKYLDIFSGPHEKFNCRLDKTNDKFLDIVNIFYKINDEFIRYEDSYMDLVKAYVLEMLVIIHRHFEHYTAENDQVSKKYNTPILDRAMFFIEEHFAEDISLSDIVAASGLSPTYFGIVFKEINGVTPWEYVQMKRVELAIEKLTRKEYDSMLELALDCGFNNYATFNRVFKKHTGVIPSKYEHEKIITI